MIAVPVEDSVSYVGVDLSVNMLHMSLGYLFLMVYYTLAMNSLVSASLLA